MERKYSGMFLQEVFVADPADHLEDVKMRLDRFTVKMLDLVDGGSKGALGILANVAEDVIHFASSIRYDSIYIQQLREALLDGKLKGAKA